MDFPKGKNTLVLFFLSSCPVCHRMIPLWNDYYSRRPKDLEVFGVMLDREPPGFFDAMPIAFPVLRSPGPALHQMFRLRHVPFMVRVLPGAAWTRCRRASPIPSSWASCSVRSLAAVPHPDGEGAQRKQRRQRPEPAVDADRRGRGRRGQ